MQINHVLLLDIDGLRPDVLQQALKTHRVPHLAELFGGPTLPKGIQIPISAPAPSITFCSQACLFTGQHPKDHGIPGNQFFDRFGTHSNGLPRHYAFDVGDTLAVDDAVRVFTDGLAQNRLRVPTVYELLANQGKTSIVAGNMYARGAQTWLKPSLAKIARFTKGGNLFGMGPGEYDQHILDQLCAHLDKNGLPDLITMYFMGLDHESHHHGPASQLNYLINFIDPLVGELLSTIKKQKNTIELPSDLFVAVFSDHGQIEVIPDDQHSLRIGFPFDKEMGYLFNALNLDVHDFPGEDPNCDAVMALNGGLAYIYLQNKHGHWVDSPIFERDVLPVAKAFWKAHLTGEYANELQGALAGILVRKVESALGWNAPFQAVTPDGELIDLDRWAAQLPPALYVDVFNRINNLTNQFSGDILLISNYQDGYYFGGETIGVHGGLHPEDSNATLLYGWPGATQKNWTLTREKIMETIEARCKAEGGRMPTTADMLTGLGSVFPAAAIE